MYPILIFLIGGVALTIGDLSAGTWLKKKKTSYYLIAVFFYLIGLNFLVISYRFSDIAVATVIQEIVNVGTLTLAGIYLFKENITKTELAGILVGILAFIVLQI